MTEHLLASLGLWIQSLISAMGYAGVTLLMAIESACIPLPSEIIMPFAGSLVAAGRFNLYLIATAGAIGCNLGSVIAYWIGAWGGRPAIERFGKYVLLSTHDLDRATHFFEKYGSATVLLGRLLPVVRTFIALPAGIARMPQWRFHLYTFLGSWPWCFVLAYVGMKLGQQWNSNPAFKQAFHRFHMAVIVLLFVGIVWFVWSHVKSRSRPTEA